MDHTGSQDQLNGAETLLSMPSGISARSGQLRNRRLADVEPSRLTLRKISAVAERCWVRRNRSCQMFDHGPLIDS